MQQLKVAAMIQNFFTPDISFTWDENFNVYKMLPLTKLAEQFCIKKYGVCSKKFGYGVPKSLFEQTYNDAICFGLCAETN